MAVLAITAAAFGAQTVYSGSAKGFGSQGKAEVTTTDGKITGLIVDDSGETYTTARITRDSSV